MKKKINPASMHGRRLKLKSQLKTFALIVLGFALFACMSGAFDSVLGGAAGSGISIAALMLLPTNVKKMAPEGGEGGGETDEQKLLKKIKDVCQGVVDKEFQITKNGLESLQKKIEAIKDYDDSALKDEVVKLAAQVKAISEAPKPASGAEKMSFIDALKKGLADKKEEIDTIVKNNGKQSGPLVIKLPVTMQTDNTIDAVGSASHYTLTSDTGIISTLRKRIMRYLENVSVGGLSIDKPYAMWIEELDEQGTPIFIGEGDAKTQLSVRYEEREKKARKIAVYGKVTTEMLRYLPQLISYIKNNMMKRMDIKTEDQLFSGDDTGDNLKGITEYASAFTGGSSAGTVTDPNNYDVLRAIALQVEEAFGMASAVFVHPGVVAQMDLQKDNEGRYLLPPFRSASGNEIAGMKIIATMALGEDEFVGGDLSVVNVSFLETATIQIGLDGNDFTNNKKTILVEQELVQFVSANDTQVLVKGTFTAAKAELLTT